ncbi:SpvB/TcaC N-terminal domain-containing protein [Pararhodobacter sp. SW119]|uniref:SpvB/TcaC N-terminal domain-containing protein n=1 Tax=Pararhodobacter sp. SW119 TaxID=2780075 RepID=UPI001ADEE300|nr:SpvB/TcaC N-terminal domain-containing protein [Pararhodobacter sp. SW119]
MGEKFSANPVTGTGSMTVPLTTSPGRSGFAPQLSLSYDSGSGNGPFGFGWSLSVPAITRKTDRGLPQYRDAEESDVYRLSGAEDLVPVLQPDGTRFKDDTTALGYVIHRYRPRIEGLFARIERWTDLATGEIHWRSITRDNVTTLYGKDHNSRIFDPADPHPTHPTRVFTWLICETYDDKGNAIVYEHTAENDDNVDRGQANERNRMRTAHRYLKRIKYGNRISRLIQSDLTQASWMFEAVFDYDEAHYEEVGLDPALPEAEQHRFARASASAGRSWKVRLDPFSSYRAGFEVRTYRRCRRFLMFHHIPDLPTGEKGYDGLVRSTEFEYTDLDYSRPVAIEDELAHQGSTRFASFIRAVTQSGYVRDDNQAAVVRNGVEYATYLKKSLPPVEFEYTQPIVQESVQDVDAASLENLPVGLDGAAYQWTDLHGEGIPGILTEQAGAWFYKRNTSPISEWPVEFASLERVAAKPNLALAGGQAQFMDLAGDGQPDLVVLDGPMPGLYEHDGDEGWQPFRPFASRLNRDMRDPNVKFVDLDGDGHADVLISEDDAFVWHPSLAEEGFGSARRVHQSLDDEKGPRLVFADGTQSIYLADLSGDGLTDLSRIRNGEVCYWPNLGYGRFGGKVTMDRAPHFDQPDQFDHKRIRLADIDGTGATDIIYLHRDGVRLYFNQSGNSWSAPQTLQVFPRMDDLVSIVPIDLLGNGTACLVWSSPLPGDARRPMRYVNLMGAQKPHLLVRTINNLGAETRIHYAPSTKFYLQDKRDGKPWITRLPFPVHVVERVETFDHVSRNRFVTRYAYHHGYFDGEEREFRGFGMVEQWDTEQFAALADSDVPADNINAESHVPPVHTKTWFHTGVYLGRNHLSDYFAGLLNATDQGEYFREPGLKDVGARALLLPDTVLPDMVPPAVLSPEEEREACRALKGSMLRQEVYSDDAELPNATAEQFARANTPYTVTEQNFTIRALQFRGTNRHGVFFTHAREAISYHYERNPADPRVQHALTLEVDAYGNVLKEAAIGYGRRTEIRVLDALGHLHLVPNPGFAGLTASDRARQTTALITYTQNRVSNAIDAADAHRTPLPSEALTFELTGYTPTGAAGRYQASDLVEPDPANPRLLRHKFAAPEVAYEAAAAGDQRRRPIEWLRTLYRRDDLGGLLPLGELQSLALPGDSYKLAFTPGLLTQVFQRPLANQLTEALLPNPAAVLGGQAGDRGGYVQSQTLKAVGLFPASDADDHWWIASGQSFYSTDPADDSGTELAQARPDFFLPRRYRDPFGQDAFVDFDAIDLLMVETRDALGNRATVDANDYRVLQPRLVSDPNRNQTEVAFDALGTVVGTAVMGKPLPAPAEGDTLAGFVTDLTQAQLEAIFAAVAPHTNAPALLRDATTRIVYDLDGFRRTQQADLNDPTRWQPACAATLARETHARGPLPPQGLKIQLGFSYSDGFGREIQKKIQAEPGSVIEGDPVVDPRWVGSGWTIFNNKGKPVRQYEPFFSATHRFEFGVQVGVSPILFYDPTERVIATLHPNHTHEQVAFDPWQQTTYDVNDTCAPRVALPGDLRPPQTGDPRTDPDIGGYVAGYFKKHPATWNTWHAQRIGGALGQDERNAALRAEAHADTPTTAHLDALGRPFMTIARNRVVCAGHDLDGTEDNFATRVELDIEGNQRAVLDERKLPINHLPTGAVEERIVMRYAYDMLGNRIHQLSMEAGARWMLNDVAGNPIRAWDSRGHNFTTRYEALRRPADHTVRGTIANGEAASDPRTMNRNFLVDRIEYGESLADAEALNLRTRIYRHFDSAGLATNARLDANDNPTEAYDFKGNLLRSTRRLARDYKAIPDWLLPAEPQLDTEFFEGSTRYDALNRPIQSIAPHSSLTRAQHPNKINVIQPVFNEANLLERVDVWLERAAEPAALLDPAAVAPSPVGVANIDYDAKGQRQRIDYKNGANTRYSYDPLTFRLTQLLTSRNAAVFPDDDQQPPAAGWPGRNAQNLHYTYDPVGNITHIQDDAQQTIYFKNKRVEPSAEYTYDARYRLIEATGREHLGQIGGAPIPHSHNDAGRVGLDWSANDGKAMGCYIERYVYDAVGNFLQMQHRGSDPAHAAWKRTYAYGEPSLIEDGTGGGPLKSSNRLTRTTVGRANPVTEIYSANGNGYDAHGSMRRMTHLSLMQWDYRDQLQATARQADNNGGTQEATWYVYDAGGERVRKVTERQAPAGQTPKRKQERLYLGGFEIFRDYNPDGSLNLERETLHVMDDSQRVALVETRTDTPIPERLIRYQFGNHLGSASLELDHDAKIISYEEYTPYGSTSYQAGRSQGEVKRKQYRYTGMERDEESGFSYHSARYYLPWLGRWGSADPAELVDGVNVYLYSRSTPSNLADRNGRSPDDSSKKSPWMASIRHIGKNKWMTTTVHIVNALFDTIPGGRIDPNGDHLHKSTATTRADNERDIVDRKRQAKQVKNASGRLPVKDLAQRKNIETLRSTLRLGPEPTRWPHAPNIPPKGTQLGEHIDAAASAHGMRITGRGQKGSATIGALGIFAIAGAAGTILVSEDKLGATLELAKEHSVGAAVGAGLVVAFGKRAGTAGLFLSLSTMKSDQAPPSEKQLRRDYIHSFIMQNLPAIHDAAGGNRASYAEKLQNTRYKDAYGQLEAIMDSPYVLEKQSPSVRLSQTLSPEKQNEMLNNLRIQIDRGGPGAAFNRARH